MAHLMLIFRESPTGERSQYSDASVQCIVVCEEQWAALSFCDARFYSTQIYC